MHRPLDQQLDAALEDAARAIRLASTIRAALLFLIPAPRPISLWRSPPKRRFTLRAA